jgi:phage shock protein A
MDEYLSEQINQYRVQAQSLGDAALEAMTRGDVGLARTASRQAAQYARIVQQLESGEKQIAPETAQPEESPAGATRADSISV